jgi:hypothetical protein
MKNQTCCFTGHRKLPPGQSEKIAGRLKTVLIHLIEVGFRDFCAGGALGFDTLAAQTVLELKKQYPQIRLVLSQVTPRAACSSETGLWRKQAASASAI